MGHVVGDKWEMPVVYLDAVCREYRAHLANERCIGRLDAVFGAHERHVVAARAREVEHLFEQIQGLNKRHIFEWTSTQESERIYLLTIRIHEYWPRSWRLRSGTWSIWSPRGPAPPTRKPVWCRALRKALCAKALAPAVYECPSLFPWEASVFYRHRKSYLMF